MRYFLIAIFVLQPSLHALEVGGRYDFFCDDGQDISNAELIGEDATHYYVKLSASVNRVPIEKKNVVTTVIKAPPPVLKSEKQPLGFSALGGAGFAMGRFSEFSAIAPAAALFGTWTILPNIAVVARTDLLRYASADSSLRILAFSAGGQYALHWNFKAFESFAGAAVGGAYLYAVAEPFREHSFIPSLVAWFGATRKLTAILALTVSVQALYLYDRETFVLLPGFLAGVTYRP